MEIVLDHHLRNTWREDERPLWQIAESSSASSQIQKAVIKANQGKFPFDSKLEDQSQDIARKVTLKIIHAMGEDSIGVIASNKIPDEKKSDRIAN